LPLITCEYLPSQLPVLTVDYVEDEAELPIAVQRRLNRERRQAQMNRQTKDSIRKQKARERSALIMQMIKYILMMVVYFFVLMGRRNVLHAQSFLDGLLTGFMDTFGESNGKTFMDIAQYADFYEWFEGPFIRTLLPDEDYSGRPIEPKMQRVMMYNRIVGGLRMRQLRVTPNAGCTIAVNVQDEFNPTRGPDAGTTRKRKYVDSATPTTGPACKCSSRRPHVPQVRGQVLLQLPARRHVVTRAVWSSGAGEDAPSDDL
jgi:hypothetical protein